MSNVVSQGDILLAQVQSLTLSLMNSKTIDTKDCVISYGKDAGDNCTLLNAIWVVPDGVSEEDLDRFARGEANSPLFICVPEKTVLRHNERGSVEIGPGYWQVIRYRVRNPNVEGRLTLD